MHTSPSASPQAICALATATGRGAIAIIRITGGGCLSYLANIFQTKKDLHNHYRQACLGNIVFEDNLLDEVIVIPFEKGRSYTNEESAEIHCHGNPIIIENILTALLKSGFVMAQPGEFTKRAFLNGRLDLSQAEAVKSIIDARSNRELQHSFRMKNGQFRKELLSLRSRLMNLLADLSAELDFVEEDIQFANRKDRLQLIEDTLQQLSTLLNNAERIEVYKKGFQIAIIGAPNSGKSSLLNFLCGKERSIVSEYAGTTRDFIEQSMQINGIAVNFIDTAGIRTYDNNPEDKQNEIEQLGIKKSIEQAQDANMIILLLDGSLEINKALAEAPIENTKNKLHCLYLVNKKDILNTSWQAHQSKSPVADKEVLFVSVKDKDATIISSIEKKIKILTPEVEGILLSAWQKDILAKLYEEMKTFQSMTVANEPQELIVSSLQLAVDMISQLTGEITNEDILGRIFSRFCIGK